MNDYSQVIIFHWFYNSYYFFLLMKNKSVEINSSVIISPIYISHFH